jgi:hypothetical protein
VKKKQKKPTTEKPPTDPAPPTPKKGRAKAGAKAAKAKEDSSEAGNGMEIDGAGNKPTEGKPESGGGPKPKRSRKKKDPTDTTTTAKVRILALFFCFAFTQDFVVNLFASKEEGRLPRKTPGPCQKASPTGSCRIRKREFRCSA